MVKRVFVCCVFAFAVSQPPVFAQTGFANMVDHIHLGVPDQAQGAEWYHTHFGGELTPEGPDRVMFGKMRMIEVSLGFIAHPAPSLTEAEPVAMLHR
jgi:hypothetical protein